MRIFERKWHRFATLELEAYYKTAELNAVDLALLCPYIADLLVMASD